MEQKEKGVKTITGGDFNVRTGREEEGIRREKREEEEKRQSRDGKINREDRILMNFVEKKGWETKVGF